MAGKKRGRPKGSRNKSKSKPMKKVTTTQQAYSKPVRNQMMMRRARLNKMPVSRIGPILTMKIKEKKKLLV